MQCSSKRAHGFALVLLALIPASPGLAQTPATPPAPGPVELSLFRTRSPANTANQPLTAVDAVAEIDPGLVLGADNCSYRVDIRITGGAGEAPVEDGWRRNLSCDELNMMRGTRIKETFSFATRPGHYTVRMAISPAGDTVSRVVERELESLPADVAVSDLYLATEIGWDSAGATNWPVRKGSIGIAAEAVVDVPVSRPFLAHYLELYHDAGPLSGTVTGAIMRPGGRRIVEFTLHALDSMTVDRPVAGTVSLAGLPVGTYEFEVRVDYEQGRSVERRRTFRVVEASAVSEPVVQRGPNPFERYFAEVSDSALTRMDAVVLWLSAEDGRESYPSLSPDGKRTFLAQLFSREAIALPDGTVLPGGEALRTLVRRVNEAERMFGGSSQGGQAAWRTDRGRLHVRFGPPADRINRPYPGNDTNPYEIWYYAIGRGFVYLFTDETGFGHYRMVYSTNPEQPSIPDWRRRAGPDAVNELYTHYGIQEPF